VLAFFRSGLWRDLLALLLLTVVLAGLLAGGAGRIVEAYFSQAVAGLVGAPGEYDAIVHLKREAGEEALRALDERLASEYPGYARKEAPTVAGHRNILIGLPKARRDQRGLESLPTVLSDVPGFDGITFIVEPAIVIRDVHPGLRGELAAQARKIDGVLFSFTNGSSVWAVLRSAADVARVQGELEELVREKVIIEVQLPVAMSGRASEALLWELVTRLEESEPGWKASALEAGESADERYALLQRARQVIAELGAVDTAELKAGLLELADEIEGAFAQTGGLGGEDLGYVIGAFRQAVDQVELLEARLDAVAGELKEAAAQGEATDLIVALLLQRLFDRLGSKEVEAPASAVDVQELRTGIEAIEETIRRLDQLKLSEVAARLRRLAAVVPGLDQDAVQEVVEALDALAPESAASSRRVSILVEGESERERVAAVAARAAGASVRVYPQSAGVVQPDARTAVLQLLAGLKQVVTVFVALLVMMLVHLFDVAALASFGRRLAEIDGRSPGRTTAALALGFGLLGAVMLAATVWLASGAEAVPILWLVVVGGAAGALFALASERCGPVDREVFCAAVSLGISEPDILREVVVPEGRPGVLYWLTRPARMLGRERARRQVFPGGALPA